MSRSSTTLYRGLCVQRQNNPSYDYLVYVNDEPLDPTPSQQIIFYSTTGFNWGYSGTGPKHLALAILLDYYGADSDKWRSYDAFMETVVQNFEQDHDWSLTGRDIDHVMHSIRVNKR
jgi:hypothetical protein